MPKFKVKDVRKIPSPDDARVGKTDYLIVYELSPLQVFMVRIPKENITEKDIIDAVKADTDAIERFTGKEYTTES